MTDNVTNCSGSFLLFDLAFANIPGIIFPITAYVNFRNVKGSGFNRIVTYSLSFQCKLVICCLAAFINFLIAIVAMINPSVVDASKEIGECL